MKTKQEQSIIEEMARCMGEKNFLCADDCENCIQIPCKCKLLKQSKLLYKAGYRKASDVIDEFVERLAKKEIIGRVKGELTVVVPCEDIKKVIIEMRQESEM